MSADEVVDYLKGYQGRWAGDFTIHSVATDYTVTFSVEQRYWWEDGALRGISVSETNEGLQTASSRTSVVEGRLVSEVVRGDLVETYYGVLHDGGIVWLPADLARATDYQMREIFVQDAGEVWLHTDGFDSYLYQGEVAHLTYRGRLKRKSEE
ncbi:MAG: hypothetical protein EA353_05545 [Puniceicoccaceae bacterium]|nr:MAG: hypothetical protein EA353_05545 [Puniceicoccaceae bacterium]